MTTSKERYRLMIEEKSLNAPFCECGCGQKTKWSIRTKSYGKYLFNHHLPNLRGNWTDYIEQVVKGTILGDAYIHPIKSRKGIETGTARLQLRHSTKRQLEYIKWKHKVLQPITTDNIRIRKTPKAFGKEAAEFSTVALPQIYEIRKQLYINGKKTVNYEYLNSLTDFSFSVWWSDDGGHNSISTHSFTEDENHLISNWLNERYGLDTWVDLDKRVKLHYIRINGPSMTILSKILFPYLHRSLWYKLGTHLNKVLP